jgi:hypothetical protein
VFGPGGEPVQERGVAAGKPRLYFVGLHFLYALSGTPGVSLRPSRGAFGHRMGRS